MSDLVQRLRQQYPETPHHRDTLHREAADELERLTRELEEARKDQARWLRMKEMPSEANSAGDDSHIAVFVPIEAFEFGEDPPSLDAAIDAAMSQEK